MKIAGERIWKASVILRRVLTGKTGSHCRLKNARQDGSWNRRQMRWIPHCGNERELQLGRGPPRSTEALQLWKPSICAGQSGIKWGSRQSQGHIAPELKGHVTEFNSIRPWEAKSGRGFAVFLSTLFLYVGKELKMGRNGCWDISEETKITFRKEMGEAWRERERQRQRTKDRIIKT